MGGKGNGKGNGKVRQVKNVALKEFGRRLAEAEEVIKQSGPLQKFKCELKDYKGKSLLEMLSQHMDRVETAMFSLTAEAKKLGWKSSKPQLSLAAAACQILGALNILDVDVEVQEAVDDFELPDVEYEADMMQKLEEGKRAIYIIRLGDSYYFKLGTYKLLKKAFNPEGPCIMDRFSNRPQPPSGLPPDTVWDLERLRLQEFVYAREELGEEPDKAIHETLRRLAEEAKIELAPPGEFHHLAMLHTAIKLVRDAGEESFKEFGGLSLCLGV